VQPTLTQSLGRRPSETAVRAFLGVEAAYLEAAFAAIRERSGSVSAYLAGLGVDDRAAGRLRELWLEPAQA
jgi:protein tyrosine/serine phosphatase